MGMILSGGMTLIGGMNTVVSGGSGGSDPYFANVVLLLHGAGANGGTTFTDSSSYNRTPSIIQDVTTSSDQTLFGQNTIKSVRGTFDGNNYNGKSILQFPSSNDFTNSNTFTLEFWLYLPSSATSQTNFMTKDSGMIYFVLGPSPNNNLTSNLWTNGVVTPSWNKPTYDTWTYIVLQSNGTNYSTYKNGIRITDENDNSGFSPSSLPLNITTTVNRNDTPAFEGYLAEIRYTQGIARYSGATIPVQSAPWPNS